MKKLVKLDIATIKVGDRARKDMGDLLGLAGSIEARGLLQPIVVTSRYELVAGGRRLAAYRDLLNRRQIDAVIVDVDDMLAAEHDENEVRKDFTVSERVAIKRAIEARIGERQGQRTDRLVGNFPQVEIEPGEKTRDYAAAKAGLGDSKTARAAERVIDHGAPELVEAMDAGKVSVSAAADVATLPKQEQVEVVARGEKEILETAKRIRAERTAQIVARNDQIRREAVKLPPPAGQYRTIVIDPPWPMEIIDRDVRPGQVGFHYPTMSIEEICAMRLPLAGDATVFMWTTQRFLPDAFKVLAAWGLKYLVTMVWHKPGGPQPYNLPQYNCEFALIGRRGSPMFMDTKAFPLCFQAPRREHSRKPDEFYDLVKRVCAGPMIDMFSREKRDGFDQFGAEPDKFGEAA